jgi:lipopolysaccharide transport system ATP-binding protein
MASISISNVTLDFPIVQKNLNLIDVGVVGCPIIERNKKTYVRSLDDINIEMKDGDRIALIGPNGAGKTNLIKTIAGIYHPTHGQVKTTGNSIALLSPGSGFSGDLSVRANVENRAKFLGLARGDVRDYVEEVYGYCKLGSYFDMQYKHLSNGMKARVGYASALCIRPDIMLFDEWISHTDAQFIDDTFNLREEFLKSVSIIVFCTHNPTIVKVNANRCLHLDKGSLILDEKV